MGEGWDREHHPFLQVGSTCENRTWLGGARFILRVVHICVFIVCFLLPCSWEDLWQLGPSNVQNDKSQKRQSLESVVEKSKLSRVSLVILKRWPCSWASNFSTEGALFSCLSLCVHRDPYPHSSQDQLCVLGSCRPRKRGRTEIKQKHLFGFLELQFRGYRFRREPNPWGGHKGPRVFMGTLGEASGNSHKLFLNIMIKIYNYILHFIGFLSALWESLEEYILQFLSRNQVQKHLGGSVVQHLPLTQVMVPGFWNRVPHRAPCGEPASPSACVSASLSVSLMNGYIKSFKKKKKRFYLNIIYTQ